MENAMIICTNCKEKFAACQRSLPKFCCFCGFALPLSIVLETAVYHENQKEIALQDPIMSKRIDFESETQKRKCTSESHLDYVVNMKKIRELGFDFPDVKFCRDCGASLPGI